MEHQDVAQSDQWPDQYDVHEYIVRLASLALEIPCTGMSPLQRDVAR